MSLWAIMRSCFWKRLRIDKRTVGSRPRRSSRHVQKNRDDQCVVYHYEFITFKESLKYVTGFVEPRWTFSKLAEILSSHFYLSMKMTPKIFWESTRLKLLFRIWGQSLEWRIHSCLLLDLLRINQSLVTENRFIEIDEKRVWRIELQGLNISNVIGIFHTFKIDSREIDWLHLSIKK